MTLRSQLHPYKTEFPEYLNQYMEQIREAVRLKKHHDHRRSLFMNFLNRAYDVDPFEVEIEHKVTVANVRGYIDALFKYVIFEFKVDLDRERPAAQLELKKYFTAQPKPGDFLGLVTDGIRFELYQYERDAITKISEFALDERDPVVSYRMLDNILFASKKTTPTSADITTRFGPHSAVFNKSRTLLESLYSKVEADSTVKVKFDEWNSLLARVYGEKIGDSALFLKHTYLTMISRLLVANALFPEVKRTKSVFQGLITGSFFAKNNLPNLVEPDFFAWALETEAENDFIGFLSSLDQYMLRYRFDNITEDIFKEIYQELVDPASRHSLGEYYTPDWIADIALRAVKYRRGKILDPACGSGTFLLAAVRRFRKKGLKDAKLVREVLDSVLGLDVHPLAVMMAKTNLVMSIANEIRDFPKEIYLPIYMADTLLVAEDQKTRSIRINVTEDEAFYIPIETTTRDVQVDELIDYLASMSQKAARSDRLLQSAWKALETRQLAGLSEHETFLWKNNFKLFTKLVKQRRDSIWAFILKNAYRPAYIRENKVDYVVGNPPWLAYRYIRDKAYRTLIKEQTLSYKLLERGDVKLFTQMDTSTLFFVYSEAHFLKDKGKIAFVLPKTTILPAKQHRKFQERGLTEIHDFSDVTPLFNVRSVLAVRTHGKGKTRDLPITEYRGNLPLKNMEWAIARKHLTRRTGSLTFLFPEPGQSHYYPLFLQGATIVPRCFWFIQPDKEAATHHDAPYVETDENALAEAKDPWKVKLHGRVEKEFLYETVLAKGLIPFAVIRAEQVFLPIQLFGNSLAMADPASLLEKGYNHAASWMQNAEDIWESRRQSPDRTLDQWLNYNQKLTKQNLKARFVVLFNASGTNLCAALYQKPHRKTDFKSLGFAADSKTYYYYPKTNDEGNYLVSVLNSNLVNRAIKPYQPQGLFGERDIGRRPFEICHIPAFDPKNGTHTALATLGDQCRQRMKPFIPHLSGRIGRVRTEARSILKTELQQIDQLVRQLLIEAGQDMSGMNSTNQRYENGDLFK